MSSAVPLRCAVGQRHARREQASDLELDRFERRDAHDRGVIVHTDLEPAAVTQRERFEYPFSGSTSQ